MSQGSPEISIGQRVVHQEFGEGVVTSIDPTGFINVFFRESGERKVPRILLKDKMSWSDRVIHSLKPATSEKLQKLWLSLEASELPFIDNAATLTSAKVDLLPHQVTLVHRIANTQPRRFLIADEVGLGKTIETALILRELASRGALERTMMVVPAGLVENWRRELNDVFNLDFEIFGSEGDVSDRRSNAFVKHDHLIVSIDTLKQPARMKRLIEAPPWDLVVFDEAHHLSVYKTGNKSKKTQNFKLAEILRDHCRDLILLSATPHQGDHFRFWMLIRLLDPTLFEDERDMVENRHRLNAVIFRRTKADACASDGSPLFARRVVNTEGFTLSQEESEFYEDLLLYLIDGYNLAALQGNQGRALGFVMTIFQKIAASSFAAVRITLQKRLLMLTLQEALERDEILDVNGRDNLLNEARGIIQQSYNLSDDPIGKAQTEQILAETKFHLVKKRVDSARYVSSSESYSDTESAAIIGEEAVASLVSIALPEERDRIKKLLMKFPKQTETKTVVLLNALKQLWQQNQNEKVVIFATYLGSIESIKTAIEKAYPEKGVEILKGGDHGAKTAALKRFKRRDGPRVLLTTAAGREGINLQHARILFNFDLPWNPMDLEQRIGRIHRYGQKHTAQVYNLVATDTIEGKIFLLLEEKLQNIAKTLGKVDDKGQVTEDLRSQILGQLGSRLSYDRLYQDAIRDPSLTRTLQEIDVAMENANLARQVVFELFQDLDKFNLGEYNQYDDQGVGMQRLLTFIQHAVKYDGGEFRNKSQEIYELIFPNQPPILFTTNRDMALQTENLNLLGLEHPLVKKYLDSYSHLNPEERGLSGCIKKYQGENALLTIWQTHIHGTNGSEYQKTIRIGLKSNGQRDAQIEHLIKDIIEIQTCSNSEGGISSANLQKIVKQNALEILHRELHHSGLLEEGASYTSQLLACIEIRA